MAGTELIRVTQLPVIEEQLRAVKDSVEAAALEAASMVCTEGTIQAVKERRAELRKQFDALEEQRKAVKNAVLAPYECFEAVYKDCITNPFKLADEALKGKIYEVERVQRDECEKMCREYFTEVCAVRGVSWLKYEQAGLKISLTEAKRKTPHGHFQYLNDFAARVACDMDAIGDDAETAAEYKANGLNLAKAQKTVRERQEAQEAERKAAEERAERRKREAEAVARVEAAVPVLAPPVAVEAPKEAEKVFQTNYLGYHIRGTMKQLQGVKEHLEKSLVDYLKQEGIQYK